MPTRITEGSYVSNPSGALIKLFSEKSTWDNSPRIKGKLKLRANPHTLRRGVIHSYSQGPSRRGVFVGSPQSASYADNDIGWSNSVRYGLDIDALALQARARFDAAARKGRSQLGINLVKYAQSRDMVASRFSQLATFLGRREKALSKSYSRRRRQDRINLVEAPANVVLEAEFGWKNLFQDLNSAIYSVLQQALSDKTWVHRKARGFAEYDEISSDFYTTTRDHVFGTKSVTVSGGFQVENLNAYLLDRAGLLNLPAIIWDAVPWSFVVNQFVNTNQFVNSLTDTIGISWTDLSTAYKSRYITDRTNLYDKGTEQSNPYFGARNSSVYERIYKYRIVGSKPPLSLQFRVPELNFEKALITGSLILSRFRSIARLYEKGRNLL